MGRRSTFQSTRPRGARPEEVSYSEATLEFQSTRPRGARRSRLRPRPVATQFQSTRPRGARRSWSPRVMSSIFVSIHAPARGATMIVRVGQLLGNVSIHAPARGATWMRSTSSPTSWVSIHAPARGATGGERHFLRVGGVSIHAPARGATKTVANPVLMDEFQSTRPRGARPGLNRRIVLIVGFNPRARAGRDTWPRLASPKARVSIHAPARGATQIRLIPHQYQSCFNPRARAGRDSACARWCRCDACFNPRARAGRDRPA
mgnify:CR=1 FL=1